jgi:LysM repeat protein
MTIQTARSRRESRENNPLRRVPRWLIWLAVGLLLMLVLDAVLVGNWLGKPGKAPGLSLFRRDPQRVYLPLMASNPTSDPKLARQPTHQPTQAPAEPAQALTEYAIRSGDTLYQIALQHDISLELLLAANPEYDENTILDIGDKLLIPPAGTKIADLKDLPVQTGGEPGTATAGQSQPDGAQATPTKKPLPALASRVSEINGVPIDKIIVLPPEVIENMRSVFAAGFEKGRNAQSFAKIGDSTIESPFFMDRFDGDEYNLGEYAFLQKAINYFQGSFARQGPAVQRGLHAWSLFDPMWTKDAACRSGETPVECEYRLQNPAFVFIRLGSNDAGRPDLFTSGMRQLIEMSLKRGIIPILGTKADRAEGDNENNQIIRDLAAEYDVPLWDFDKVARTLPNNGIGEDGVHLTTFYAHDFSLPEALQTGYGVHTLTALMMLYELWRILVRS